MADSADVMDPLFEEEVKSDEVDGIDKVKEFELLDLLV